MQEKEVETYKEYPICRTCLNVIRTKSYRLQENSGCGAGLKISHVLRYIVPELYLGLSNSPEICGNCRESLRVAYTFRKLCLETETMIGNYLKTVRCTAQIIDLGSVISYLSNKKTQQAAQKIISEWEDDSEEQAVVVEQSNKKIPISNLQTLKNAVASGKQVPEKSSPSINICPSVQVPSEKEEGTKKETIINDLVDLHNDSVKDIDEKLHTSQSDESPKNAEEKDQDVILVESPEQQISDSALLFCEETGLLRNIKGEYFNLDGTAVNREQVEKEKTAAKIRAENLFQISNIFTVTDDDFDTGEIKTPETVPDSNNSQSSKNEESDSTENVNVTRVVEKLSELGTAKQLKTVRKELQVRDISELMARPEDKIKSDSPQKTYSKILEIKPIQKTYKRSRRLPKFDKTTFTFSTEQNALINPLAQSGESDASKVRETNDVPKTNILNFLINKNLGLPMPETMPPLRNIEPKIQVKSFAKEENLNRSDNILDNLEKTDLPPTPTFDTLSNVPIVDPLQTVRIKEELQDSDTTSVPDNSEFGPWQNIINSLDDCGNNYVDVPDFVQINNVTVKDLTDLRPSEGGEMPDDWLDKVLAKKMEGKKLLAGEDKSPDKSGKVWKNLPERFPYNGKMLVRCGNYYKVDNAYVDDQPGPKKIFRRTIKVSDKRKLKLVPVDPEEASALSADRDRSNDDPDRQVCVLFTNYTNDGLYINDHDYLMSPYVRNKILVHEGNDVFCVCYICGKKHWLQRHVQHMRSHSSKCPECKANLGTAYMLNLHMKSHSKSCKKCNILVPYPQMIQHALGHKNDEAGNSQDAAHSKKEQTNPDVKRVKKCFVPTCTNTTRNSSKIFINVPRRCMKKWTLAVGRLRIPKKESVYCCEDHFDMEKDCTNWQEYKLMNSRLRMRDVVPHKFVAIPSTVPKRVSQFDEESRKMKDENVQKLMGEGPSVLETHEPNARDSRILYASAPDSKTTSREETIRTRSRRRRKLQKEETKQKPALVRKTNRIKIRLKTRPDDSEDEHSNEPVETDDCEDKKTESESIETTERDKAKETENSSAESDIVNVKGKKRRIISDDEDDQEGEVLAKRILRSRIKKPSRKKRASAR